MTKTTTTVVVGGGAAGLAAAVELARAGRRVTVLEAASEVGGRARSGGTDGFALNLGPHALYPRAAARLRELGLSLTGRVPDRGFFMELDGEIVPLPVGAGSLVFHGSLPLATKWRFGAFLARAARMDPAALAETSLAQLFDDAGLDPLSRKLAAATARLVSYCDAPDRLSAGAFVTQLREGTRGVRYLDGGWRTIVEGLVSAARDAGASVRTRARAAELTIEGGRVRGVRLRDGERLEADEVVLAVSPRVARTLLSTNASGALRTFAERATPVRAACLDVSAEVVGTPHPNVVLGVDRPTYLSVHSAFADLGPGAVVHVARYLTPGLPPSPDTRAELRALLAAAHPAVAASATERWSPALTVMHALPEVALGGLPGRPSAGDAGPPGVVLAGDWVGPRGILLDAALSSAHAAAQTLIEASPPRARELEARARARAQDAPPQPSTPAR